MKTTLVYPLVLTLLAGFAGQSAGEALESLQCGRGHAQWAPPTDPDQRQYAPSREIDLLHLAIDVTPDFQQRIIAAKTTLTFKPMAKPVQELRLDAADLSVASVVSTAKLLGHQTTDRHIVVTFDQPIPPERETSVTISYTAAPAKGLYFRTPEMGYKTEDMHLWTQGEPIEARHWFPSFDAPNEKFTSEVTCRVPEGMVVLSNGRLISEEKDAGSGLVAARWLQDKPHVTYLIALAAGYFKKVEDKYKDIPLAFYTPASQIAQAPNSFRDTKDIMAFFEEEIGVPYPWAKYDQVCVDDFGWGGMENTSLTILHDRTLHTPDFETLRSSQGLVAHELAHQWFGDLVTCKDWAHLWLNEGFATYYDALYEGHKQGRDTMLYGLYQSAQGIMSQPNQTNSIVRRDYREPEQQFSYLAYPKGAWVLHMLRSQLGEELFRRCIKTYLDRHKFGTVVTEDLNAVLEELSGRSFDRFFDQWVYHASQPGLGVSYSWDDKTKLAKVSVQQNQKLSERVMLFQFPLPVRFKGKSGAVDRQMLVREKSEDFYFPLPEAPDIVRIDPDLTVLAKVNFSPPNAMLYAQLADPADTLGRWVAAEQLGAKKDRGAVAKLKEALNRDPFYGVRVEAAKALRAIDTDPAYEGLLASTPQADARVRRQVLAAITGFYRERSFEAAQQALRQEKNPDIQSLAVGSLGAYPKPEVRTRLLELLKSESYRNILADAAVGAVRAQDDACYIDPLLEVLQQRESAFTTAAFGRGLDTLAYLARDDDAKKDAVREFLLRQVNHKKQRVQLAAIGALGTLGDPKAIAALETFTTAVKDSPERGAAERAAAALRDGKKPSAELGSLRNDVLNLQKENRELRKELEDLKKKWEANAVRPAESKSGKKAPKRQE